MLEERRCHGVGKKGRRSSDQSVADLVVDVRAQWQQVRQKPRAALAREEVRIGAVEIVDTRKKRGFGLFREASQNSAPEQDQVGLSRYGRQDALNVLGRIAG